MDVSEEQIRYIEWALTYRMLIKTSKGWQINVFLFLNFHPGDVSKQVTNIDKSTRQEVEVECRKTLRTS